MSIIKKTTISLLIAGASGSFAMASEGPQFSLGLVSHISLVGIEYNELYLANIYTGGGLTFTAGLNDNIALRGLFASRKGPKSYANDLDLMSNVFEGKVLLGTGLKHTGPKYYGSVGYFNNLVTNDMTNTSQNYDGISFGFGFGYNWDRVGLESWSEFNTPPDEEDYLFVYSFGNSINFRF